MNQQSPSPVFYRHEGENWNFALNDNDSGAELSLIYKPFYQAIGLLDSAFYVRDKGVEINNSVSDMFINYLLNTSKNKINFGMTIPCDIL